MAEELEIKLTVEESGLEQARHWLLGQQGANEGVEKTLLNRYYDTPDSELNRLHAALRVRRAGDKFIQTLKTKGEFVAGAHRREESEWVVPDENLDTQLLANSALAGHVDLSRLQIVFETNFTRRIILLEQEGALIEAAMDSGRVLAGDRARALHEVEFELKAGDSSALLHRARALAEQIPVFLNLVSKAEQGYFLAGLHQPQIPCGQGAPVSINEFLYGLGLCWLRGEPYPVQDVDLSEVARIADVSGVGKLLERVLVVLSEGAVVGPLTASGELGQLQLALAAA